MKAEEIDQKFDDGEEVLQYFDLNNIKRSEPEVKPINMNFSVSIPDLEETCQKTILERVGGLPEFTLHGGKDLSDRDIRKKIIAEKIRQKHQERHQ